MKYDFPRNYRAQNILHFIPSKKDDFFWNRPMSNCAMKKHLIVINESSASEKKFYLNKQRLINMIEN